MMELKELQYENNLIHPSTSQAKLHVFANCKEGGDGE